MRRPIAVFIIACFLAAAAPFVWRKGTGKAEGQPAFPGWPTAFAGALLSELPLTAREQQFLKGFPGRVGRFACADMDLVIRWVARETRMLHPASDCYRALGYDVEPLPLHIDSAGGRWGTLRCTRAGQSVLVREQITDAAGRSFSDVSAWYWSALTGRSEGPWWAVTVVTSE